MACNVTLSGIAYDCDDLGIGGIVELHIAERSAVTGVVTADAATRNVSAASGSASPVTLGFNLKDGFSVFSEVKTVNADGTTTTVPTISVELPKMDSDKTTAINQMAVGGAELVAFVKTAAGTFHISGLDYGLYVSNVDGNSGTGRAEKNRFQLTLTGEENGLSYGTDEGTFNTLVA
jgi:hypothetical protein